MILKFNKFNEINESNSDVEEFLNSILDKILIKKPLSNLEKDFLNSYQDKNEDLFYENFKKLIRNSQYLDNLKSGSMFDIVMYNPNHVAVSTKEVEKLSDDEFYIHSTSDGWMTAKLDKEELISLMVGELSTFDLNWE